eukprot:CAMPEP_0179009522 /NCGR_PEP_ID=MMETSP0795-20121207/16317_1 /TAXON_ID=88552 /ORGANISM="Amoebophrya sp., Strain Ameob2" /LENGTH=289 /DNA_ID=CAMNT_0020704725 /DNA_START=593 /DNA_END=1461 /DNA_ORIENTATION=-
MNHRQADMAPAAATTSTATTTSPNYRTGGQTQEMVSPPTSTSADGRTKASLWAFVLLMSFAFGGWLVKRWIVLQRKARIIEERNELKALQEEIAVVDVSSSSYEHLGRRVVGATHLQVGVGLGGSSASEDVGGREDAGTSITSRGRCRPWGPKQGFSDEEDASCSPSDISASTASSCTRTVSDSTQEGPQPSSRADSSTCPPEQMEEFVREEGGAYSLRLPEELSATLAHGTSVSVKISEVEEQEEQQVGPTSASANGGGAGGADAGAADANRDAAGSQGCVVVYVAVD